MSAAGPATCVTASVLWKKAKVVRFALPTRSPGGSKVIYRVGGRMKILPAQGGAATDLFELFPSLKDRHLVLSGSHPVHWK